MPGDGVGLTVEPDGARQSRSKLTRRTSVPSAIAQLDAEHAERVVALGLELVAPLVCVQDATATNKAKPRSGSVRPLLLDRARDEIEAAVASTRGLIVHDVASDA